MKNSAGTLQLGDRILNLLGHYRSGTGTLGAEFFAPCMKEATRYRRAAGYFSSSALATWASSLPRLVFDHTIKIQLIASPELSEEDVSLIKKLTLKSEIENYKRKLADKVLESIGEFTQNTGNLKLRAEIFCWLIANERLEIRFAFPSHVAGAELFHAKYGVFDFPTGNQIAFIGSANETFRGHNQNYETIDVYRDWINGDKERVKDKVAQFDEAWENKADGLAVLCPSEYVINKLKARSPKSTPKILPGDEETEPVIDQRWIHQDEAVSAFMAKRSGILEMATGTGKTRTSIKILERLIDTNLIDSAIITTDGTDLLEQWSAELEKWALNLTRQDWMIYRYFGKYHQLNDYFQNSQRSIIVISRAQLYKLSERMKRIEPSRTFIVHDEVHGLGQPMLVNKLRGFHSSFGFKVGLSATPERTYDKEGSDFITSELGEVIFEFSLEKAIARGVLCEFDYQPLNYELTQNDKNRLKAIQKRRAASLNSSNPMTNEEFWTEISKVYKTAEKKPEIFSEFLKRNSEILKNIIIFVETRDYGENILPIIQKYTHRYKTYYADDDREDLVRFARGDFDCLITCHRISQGIDIKSLENVVLFASARAKLETIQRIGRCLRLDPKNSNKKARVIDFVLSKKDDDPIPSADEERLNWLNSLSKIRKGDQI